MNWQDWQKTVNYIIETRGRWYGLGDGDGFPLVTLPEPGDFAGPDQWMGIEDIEMTLPAEGEWMDRLILDDLEDFSVGGRLKMASGDYTLLFATKGEDGETVRRGGVVTHATAEDPNNTGQADHVTINAISAGDVWNTTVAVSWPRSWWRATPYTRTSDESGREYSQGWEMARIEMATRITYVNKYGPAGFVIRRLAQESLDAVMSAQRDPDGTVWIDDPFHVVEVPDKEETLPNIALEARDGSLWETVQSQAANSGALLGARIWWPGDRPVRCWDPVTSETPEDDIDLSPDDGSEPTRGLAYREFPHAMIILTVEEVK